VNATRIYREFSDDHRLTEREVAAAFEVAKFVHTPEESRALNERREPMIILSASGMATGGRVLHHIEAFGPDPRNLLLFVGFQAAGTRGATIAAGVPAVKIHGEYVRIRAEVVCMDSLSAHADGAEVLAWLRGFARPPRRTFITHGEPAASDELRRRVQEMRWECEVPEYRETTTLE
jgi:metallo-beta-lactamase family protein